MTDRVILKDGKMTAEVEHSSREKFFNSFVQPFLKKRVAIERRRVFQSISLKFRATISKNSYICILIRSVIETLVPLQFRSYNRSSDIESR